MAQRRQRKSHSCSCASLATWGFNLKGFTWLHDHILAGLSLGFVVFTPDVAEQIVQVQQRRNPPLLFDMAEAVAC
jgi:hypothetical protein